MLRRTTFNGWISILAGMGVMAFGGGAILAAPLSEYLFKTYGKLPELLGTTDAVNVITEGGRRMAEVGGELREVIVAGADSLSTMPGIVESGVYLAGTGDTGVASTFLSLSALYTGMMITGALTQRSPWPGFPAIGEDAKVAASSPTSPASRPSDQAVQNSEPYVDVADVLKLPQFYLLWLGVCGNAMAGVSIISCAKTIMGEVFGKCKLVSHC